MRLTFYVVTDELREQIDRHAANKERGGWQSMCAKLKKNQLGEVDFNFAAEGYVLALQRVRDAVECLEQEHVDDSDQAR